VAWICFVAGVQVHGLPNAARKSKGKAVLLRNEEKTAAGDWEGKAENLPVMYCQKTS